MKIAIIGVGNVGSALGTGWAKKGHSVTFGVRNPQDEKVKKALAGAGKNAQAATVSEAAKSAEVVVLATPWPATQEAVQSAGNLSGKIVVDCVNPLKPDLSGLAIGQTTSAAEQVAGWAKGAKVVKAFNTTGAGNMANPKYGSQNASMFICSDDAAARKTVGGLAEDLGFEVVDAGPLVMARALEPVALLWIYLAYGGGLGPNFAFKILKR